MDAMSTSWHSYPKIYAIGHRAINRLFVGPVIVEEKIDGSQFSFGVIDGELRIRSKGQQMVVDAPEKMFNKAVETVKELVPLLVNGWTYRAEYLQKPKHNALAYDRVPAKHLAIFDVNTGHGAYMDYDAKCIEAERLGLECVPRLHFGTIETAEELRALLTKSSMLGGIIEGVVVKNYAQFGEDGKVLLGKFVSEAFKEVHKKEWGESNPAGKDIVDRIGDGLRMPARWHKSIQHKREDGTLEGDPRDIGDLIKRIQSDVKEECEAEVKDALFAWAWPHLQRKCIAGFPEWYKQKLLGDAFTPAEGAEPGQ